MPAKLLQPAQPADAHGTPAAGMRTLASQLDDEIVSLLPYVKSWELEGGADKQMQPWQEFWGDLTLDEDFAAACPLICKLLQIVLVMPNGSVENERGFSAMNRLLDELRNAMLFDTLNAVICLSTEKNKMLRDYSPVITEFVRRMLADAGFCRQQAKSVEGGAEPVQEGAATGAAAGVAAEGGAAGGSVGGAGMSANGDASGMPAAVEPERDAVLDAEDVDRSMAAFFY